MKIKTISTILLISFTSLLADCKTTWTQYQYQQKILIKDNSNCKEFKKTIELLQKSINECAKEKTPVISAGNKTNDPNEIFNSIKDDYKKQCIKK